MTCATCSRPLANLGYKIRLPAKDNIKQWEALRTQYLTSEREAIQRRRAEEQRWKHDLKREIERLQSLPANPGRSKAVLLLKKKLDGTER